MFEDGVIDRGVDLPLAGGKAQQDVISKRLAKQNGGLGRVGASWGHAKRRGIFDAAIVPVQFPAFRRQQA